MSDEQKSAGDGGLGFAAAGEHIDQSSADEHTTEPNASQTGESSDAAPSPAKWQMPKPKFQQSSGYLPQGYLKEVEAAAMAAAKTAGSEDTTQEQAPYLPESAVPPPVQSTVAIEPQPDLSEQLLPDEPVVPAAVETPQKQGSSTVWFAVLGLIGIVLFVAAFIAIVYFLFFLKPVETQLG